MKIAIITDQHFGVRNDSEVFHMYMMKFYKEIFFPYILENEIKVVINAGDFLDRRKYINYKTLNLVRDEYLKFFEKNNIVLHNIVGNHDTFYKSTNSLNSVTVLFEDKNLQKNLDFHIYNSPQRIYIDGRSIDIIPWIAPDIYNDTLSFIKNSESEIAIGHLGVEGFKMHKNSIANEGIDRNIFEKYKLVLSGHYHTKSNDGKIFYLGAPCEYTWNDYNDDRGFHILDTNSLELTYIKNPFHMFHKLVYDEESDFDWDNFDFSKYKNTIIKLVVVNKSNFRKFDEVLLKFDANEVYNLTTIEELDDEKYDIDNIETIEDTVTLLNSYADELNTDENSKNKIKNIMHRLYIEAVNMEQ